MTKPVLGVAVDGGAPIEIDIERLIGTDLCIVGKKGFGKSGLLRVLFEQTRPLIQQIILDPEGEFFTLRERADYLVAGGDTGDCPAAPANARALAKMLMENPGISAVIQLDHLESEEQEEFVELFIVQMMATPRKDWHPVMVCVDETQRFAPQDKRVASSAAMKDMVQRGRKRGITPVFATLSFSAIDKDLIRGVSTWLFGCVGTDIDRRLVANSLAMPTSSPDAKELPFLPPRRFWAFGQPVSSRPVLFDVAEAQTTIVKSGGALVAMPPPPKSLQKLLQALSKAAAPETPADPVPAAPGAPSVDLEAIRAEARRDGLQEGVDRGIQIGLSQALGHLRPVISALEGEAYPHGDENRDLLEGQPTWVARVTVEKSYVSMDKPVEGAFVQSAIERATESVVEDVIKKVRTARPPRADGELSEGAANLISAARMAHRPVSWAEAAMLAGRIPAGGYHNSVMKELRDDGWSEPPTNDLASDGPFLSAEELAVKMGAGIGGKDKGAARAVFDHLWAVGPRTKLQVAEDMGRQPSGGYWNATWKALRSSPRVHERDGLWDIASILREVAGSPTAQP